MELITSLHNPRYKAALKLNTSRGRKLQDRIIIFGEREIRRACESSVQIIDLFLCEGYNDNELDKWLQNHPGNLAERGCVLAENLFLKLSYGDRHEGIIAVAERPQTTLTSLREGFNNKRQLAIVVLQSIEKPGNLGAVVRSADGAGFDAVWVADPICDPFHPNCIRASLGTVFSVPIVCDRSATIFAWLQRNDVNVFSTRVDGKLTYDEVDFCRSSAIVLGNEAAGLDAAWDSEVITPIRIPMRGIVDSLNLSATAAIVCYELARQRNALDASASLRAGN